MNFKGKSQQTAENIIQAFKDGNIPEPVATIFINRNVGDRPMYGWSYLNQFSCLVSLCTDARGFRQWEKVGRKVIKGQKAQAYILVPLIKKREEELPNGKTMEVPKVYGFRGQAVFDITQTDGDPLAESEDVEAERQFLANLPLMPVAEHFGLKVATYSGREGSARGVFSPSRELIALGVENVDTWLHELIHAADHKLGNLTELGQHWRSETVAQLGAATLATVIGLEGEANLGKTWRYISSYAEAAEIEPITACLNVLERMCKAIELVLATAEKLTPVEQTPIYA